MRITISPAPALKASVPAKTNPIKNLENITPFLFLSAKLRANPVAGAHTTEPIRLLMQILDGQLPRWHGEAL
jgi:hypothetical protein